jgi:hypothetical protein
MKMKSGILIIVTLLFFVAGCTKSAQIAASQNFVGSYNMRDTLIIQNFNGTTTTYDTVHKAYIMSVTALSANIILFNNINGCSSCLDTASVLGNIASVTSVYQDAATAVLNGNTIKISGGGIYSGNQVTGIFKFL